MDRQKLGKAGTFILGGVAGAVVGVLISPRSGRELRGAMSSRAGEARERGRESYFEARERARERMAGMREPRPADEETREMEEVDLGSSEGAFVGEEDEAAPAPPGAQPLRAVPLQEPLQEPGREEGTGDPDSEALRSRIRQTRERLGRRRPGGGADG